MRQTFIVSYDISDPKRLRKVFRTMRGYGDHMQLSVFRCDMTESERLELRGKLEEIINHREDQVLFVDVGPADGRGATSIASMGRAHMQPQRHAIVI